MRCHRFSQALLLLLALLLSRAGTARAGVEQVRVRVDGLACPFCVYNVEKRVKTLAAVERKAPFRLVLKTGMATFAWTPSIVFAPAAVREQVRKAGFTPGPVAITATGSVRLRKEGARGGSQLVLFDEGTKQAIVLRASRRADRAESYRMLSARARHAREPGKALRVRLEGQVQGENPWHVVLQRWEPLRYAAKVVVGLDGLACERCSTRLMRALAGNKDVVHIEADHETDRVSIWTRSRTPQTAALREQIEGAGFKVTDVKATPSAVTARGKAPDEQE